MFWDKAYLKLNLAPLDGFIAISIWGRARKKHLPVPSAIDAEHPAFRQIGATTWMCVCAAWTICDGRDVLLYTSSLREAERQMGLVCDYALRLSPLVWEAPRITVNSTMRERIRFTNGASIYGTTLRRNERFNGVVFEDNGWKERAIRRFLGPFAMTKAIKHEEGRYYAYAEDDELLMELTVQGATDLINQRRGEIDFVGFGLDGTNEDGILRPFPSQVIRGATTFGMTGVTKSIGIKEGLVMDKINPGKY